MAIDDLIELGRTFTVVTNQKPTQGRARSLLVSALRPRTDLADLLLRPRVVLLAEQLSGKNSEFKLRQQQQETTPADSSMARRRHVT